MARALTAGILAAVNPCGFAMLPAYVCLLVANSEQGRLRRALSFTSATTLGFVAVFGAFGLIAAPLPDRLEQRLPWLTVVIGVVLMTLGAWLAGGRDIPSPVPKHPRAPELTNKFGPMFLFGVSFAMASLGSIGPFLTVVGGSLGSTGGLAAFLTYAGGMALAVGTVTIAVALAQQPFIGRLKRHAAATHRLAGVLMLLAGVYVAWYGWFGIRQATDATMTDPVIEAAGAVQTWLAVNLERIGAGVLAVVLAALTTGLMVTRTLRSKAG